MERETVAVEELLDDENHHVSSVGANTMPASAIPPAARRDSGRSKDLRHAENHDVRTETVLRATRMLRIVNIAP